MNIRAGTSKWMTDRLTGIVHLYTRKKWTSSVEAKCGHLNLDDFLTDPKKKKTHFGSDLEICEQCEVKNEEVA